MRIKTIYKSIPKGVQNADVDAPDPLYPLLHSEVRKRPIRAHTLFLIITTADSSPLTPLLLLLSVCEEQARRTLRGHMKRHLHIFPRECQEWHARGVPRGAEQRMSLF